ncbi:IS256 family transposase [Occultella glacieicola]
MVRAVLEAGLATELSDHLGDEKGDPAGRGSPNSRNGSTPKTVATEVGDVALATPRDRARTFTPRLVPKGARRVGGLDEMIISLYAGGMTVRDIGHHLAATLGTELSPDTISNITDTVTAEVIAWQNRPLEAIYPIIYMDAIVAGDPRRRAREQPGRAHRRRRRPGRRQARPGDLDPGPRGREGLGRVCVKLANRGVKDVLIVCCDGLSGFPEAIEATWPQTTVQTCVVHLIRAAMRFVSYNDRKAVAAALRPIYTASSADVAETELVTFADSNWGKKYPAAVATWTNAWERFIPFLAFPPAVRKIIYTTNSAESLNFQLRKIIKNRGHFPSDEAATKLLWLAIMNIEDKRARERAKERGKPANKRKAPGRLVEGQTVTGWTAALNALAIAHPERLAGYLI